MTRDLQVDESASSAPGAAMTRRPALANSSWREQAIIRADILETLLITVVEPRASDRPDAVWAVADRIRRHLDIARSAATDVHRSPLRRLRSVFTKGADLERVLGNLDAAEAELLSVAPEPFVRGQVRVLLAEVRRLPLADSRRTVVEELSRRPRGEELSAADRSALVSAVRAADENAQRDLVRVRSYRNMLLAATTVMSILAVGLAIVGAGNPDLLPLCYVPGNAVVCPTGSISIALDDYCSCTHRVGWLCAELRPPCRGGR